MASQEDQAISALTGFSLDHVLGGLSLPSSSGLTNQLGISGIPTLSSSQIYSDKWEEDDEAVGLDQGEDWEAEIDREMQEEEESEDTQVKKEAHSPNVKKERRVRVVKRLVERPPTVEERFPTFAKDKILDFSELFKGYTVRKSRLSKRPYQS
jgi:transcription initiation factor TFIID subunit 1